jgi:hypothetical protein
VHLVLETFLCHIAIEARLRGVHEIFGAGWLPYQPSHDFDDVWTHVFDRVLVIFIPSHLLGSVSAKCIFISGSSWEYLGVVGPESQGGEIPELTGPMRWLYGSPGSNWLRW